MGMTSQDYSLAFEIGVKQYILATILRILNLLMTIRNG